MAKSRMSKELKIAIIVLSAVVALFIAFVAFLASGYAKSMFYNILESISYRQDAPRRERFEQLLEEKYGEEFVCFKIEYKGSAGFNPATSIVASCAPIRDKSLVFDAWMGVQEDSSISFDFYATAIANQQLTELLSAELSDLWGEYYLECSLGGLPESDEVFQKIKDRNLDWQYYVTECGRRNKDDNRCDTNITICIDNSTAKVSYEQEWESLHSVASNIRDMELSNGVDMEISFFLFFAPRNLYDDCVKVMTSPNYNYPMQELEEMLNGYPEVKHQRVIYIDTTHKAEDPSALKIPRWLNTTKEYEERRIIADK